MINHVVIEGVDEADLAGADGVAGSGARRYSAFSSSVTSPTDFFASPNSIEVLSA